MVLQPVAYWKVGLVGTGLPFFLTAVSSYYSILQLANARYERWHVVGVVLDICEIPRAQK